MSLPANPIKVGWEGCPYTSAEVDDALPATIHAARDDDDSIDIFGPTGASLWQRLTSRWGRFKAALTGPVPGDDGATIGAAHYPPWGFL